MTGDELRNLRRDLGLTQAELAKQLGMAWLTISKYERLRLPIPKKVALALKKITRRLQ